MSGILHGALELGQRVVVVPDWRRDSAAKISVDTELDARLGREIPDDAANDEEGDLRGDARDSVGDDEKGDLRGDAHAGAEPSDPEAPSTDDSTDDDDDDVTIPMLAAAS